MDRLHSQWHKLILVHLPVHASWLNQIEIYFSVLQRKALTPDDFDSREDITQRILDFQDHYQTIAQPFQWSFTRNDLERLLQRALFHSCSLREYVPELPSRSTSCCLAPRTAHPEPSA